MKESVIEEVGKIIADQFLRCTVEEFKDKVDRHYISLHRNLSDDFIREFKNKVNWDCISCRSKLSEVFIREFKDKVNWRHISTYQRLSEDFIREFKDYVYWDEISDSQTLSEDFIREFKDRLYLFDISCNQPLSESFIREFKDRVDWDDISSNQKLSEDFIREFKDNIDVLTQKAVNEEKTIEQKTKEIEEYAKIHKLKFDGEYLYAFRNHDQYGRGVYKKASFYETGKYYKDWHCDMRENEENSFGLGIWPRGNTAIKVKIEDWGVAVSREDGKARVWGFEVMDVH